MSVGLELSLARKRFGPRTVLEDVDLSVRPGELVALLGPSGCGKSTLLRIIAGLDRDFTGVASLGGKPLYGRSREIGFVFQEPRLLPWLSVRDNVAFETGKGGDGDPRVDALLREVGLAGLGDALPRQLSGGQAQRVALARGLFARPKLLLLDEPFSAVDALTRIRLQDLLLSLMAAHGFTAVLVTHDLDEAFYLAERVLVLGNAGVIRELAVPQQRPRDRGDASLARLKASALGDLSTAHLP